jgi:hypothetical protein
MDRRAVRGSVLHYLEQGLASNALAACEVLARLRGRPDHKNAYTNKVDQWVAQHLIDPLSGLVTRGEPRSSEFLAQNLNFASSGETLEIRNGGPQSTIFGVECRLDQIQLVDTGQRAGQRSQRLSS